MLLLPLYMKTVHFSLHGESTVNRIPGVLTNFCFADPRDRRPEIRLNGVAEIVIDDTSMLHHQLGHLFDIIVHPLHELLRIQFLRHRREIFEVRK